jgi:L-aspartate oxidase
VFLDTRDAIGDAFPAEFPTVTGYCRESGIDPVRQPIPVAPAAHYHMGGVLVDANGRSTIDGLWACGEAASTGAHGANRLASNSLLEAVVFAARIADDIHGLLPSPQSGWTDRRGEGVDSAGIDESEYVAELRRTMTEHVGVIRERAGLLHALEVMAALEGRATSRRMRNRLVTAKLIATAALRRDESRGAHFRSDFPEPNPAMARRSFLTLADAESEIDRVADEPALRQAVLTG